MCSRRHTPVHPDSLRSIPAPLEISEGMTIFLSTKNHPNGFSGSDGWGYSATDEAKKGKKGKLVLPRRISLHNSIIIEMCCWQKISDSFLEREREREFQTPDVLINTLYTDIFDSTLNWINIESIPRLLSLIKLCKHFWLNFDIDSYCRQDLDLSSSCNFNYDCLYADV